VRRLAALALTLLAAFACAEGAGARCLYRGVKVALLGAMYDPDVLVWDSRFRLSEYQTGTYDATHLLLPHAWILKPGTRGIVRECVPGVVRPRFRTNVDDAVRIVILNGPYAGRLGWVLSEDVRVMRRARR